MKVAFDENMPAAMVRVFQGFQKEQALKDIAGGITIKKAQDYYPNIDDPDYVPKDDAPWIRRFAADGGKAIISGNTKMRKVPHERLALVQTRMIVIFFASKWSGWKFCRKCSLLIHWWPNILDAVKNAEPGFYMVPSSWPDEHKAALRQVSTEDLRLVKIERQKAARASVRKARKRRRNANDKQGDFFG